MAKKVLYKFSRSIDFLKSLTLIFAVENNLLLSIELNKE